MSAHSLETRWRINRFLGLSSREAEYLVLNHARDVPSNGPGPNTDFGVANVHRCQGNNGRTRRFLDWLPLFSRLLWTKGKFGR